METIWTVLVTDGMTVEYPPELYESKGRAIQEARRWAWLLSAGHAGTIRTPFEGRWEAGFRDVRLITTQCDVDIRTGLWVGTFWTRDGYPDPEALVLPDREAAVSWCNAPLAPTLPPSRVEQGEWSVAATFNVRGGEAYAVAHLAKLVQ